MNQQLHSVLRSHYNISIELIVAETLLLTFVQKRYRLNVSLIYFSSFAIVS